MERNKRDKYYFKEKHEARGKYWGIKRQTVRGGRELESDQGNRNHYHSYPKLRVDLDQA